MAKLIDYSITEILDGSYKSITNTPSIEGTRFYIKFEADKVFSELKVRIAQLEDDNALLRKNNAELRSKNEGLLYALAGAETDLAMATRWRNFKDEPPEHHQYIEACYCKDMTSKRKPIIEIRRWDEGMKYDVFEQELYVGWRPLPKAPEVK